MAHLSEDDVLLEHNAAIASLTDVQRAAIARCGEVRKFSAHGLFGGYPPEDRLRAVCRVEAQRRNRFLAA